VAFATLLLWDFLWRRRGNGILPGPRPLPFLGNLLMYRGLDPEREFEFQPIDTVCYLAKSIAIHNHSQ